MHGHVVVLAVGLILLPINGLADFEDGVAAFYRGNYERAFAEFRWLAEQGHAPAQYRLGVMYDDGKGVRQDDAEAVKWYRRAAEQGHAPAQSALGVRYATGQGVPQDYVTAYAWTNIAAAHGHTNARKVRDWIRDQMIPAQLVEGPKTEPRNICSNSWRRIAEGAWFSSVLSAAAPAG